MTMDWGALREMALGLLAVALSMAALSGLFYLAIWMQNHWPWFVATPIIAFIAYHTSPYARYRRRS